MFLGFLPLKTIIYFGVAFVLVIGGLIAWGKNFK